MAAGPGPRAIQQAGTALPRPGSRPRGMRKRPCGRRLVRLEQTSSEYKKSPGQCRGFLDEWIKPSSVARATRVEAVDQRGADGLHPRLEGSCESVRKTGRYRGFRKRDPIIEGRTIFGLHEPARRGDAEKVQAVFDAAADEPTVTMEGGCGCNHRTAGSCQRR